MVNLLEESALNCHGEADELERAQKDQDRLQNMTWLTLPGNSPIFGPRKKQQLQKQAAPSDKSAIDVQTMRRTASKLGERGREHTN